MEAARVAGNAGLFKGFIGDVGEQKRGNTNI